MAHMADVTLVEHPLNWHVLPPPEERANRAGKRRPNVAILGAGPGRVEAPFDDQTWEIWCLNAVPPLTRDGLTRCDRWFELHEAHAQDERDWRWIERCPFPLYVPPHDGRLLAANLHAVPFPLAEIEAQFGSYFACSFAYMMALAAHEQFSTVGLFGIELHNGDERERTVELSCISWWAGLLEGIGVNITAPASCWIGRHYARYGIEYDAEKVAVEKYLRRLRRGDQLREEYYARLKKEP